MKNPPVLLETWVQSLGREGPLEEGMATHSSIPAWRIPRTEEPGGPQSRGHKESDTTGRLHRQHRTRMSCWPNRTGCFSFLLAHLIDGPIFLWGGGLNMESLQPSLLSLLPPWLPFPPCPCSQRQVFPLWII